MADKKTVIVIPRTGLSSNTQHVRGIYNPDMDKVLKTLGETETNRASHVEPGAELSKAAVRWLCDRDQEAGCFCRYSDDGITLASAYRELWWADLLPVKGPVLGPFSNNTSALTAEVDWLVANNIPPHVCKPCELSNS